MERGVAQWIFDWAALTPDKPAIIGDGSVISYRAFAAQIAVARGYFARRGIGGEGRAAIVVLDLRSFWVLSLALRSLGLTTFTVETAASLAVADLSNLALVVTRPEENRAELQALCAERGWPLLSVIFNDERPLDLAAREARVRHGGHILRTSGTTGAFKKVLIDPAFEEAMMFDRNGSKGFDQNSIEHVFSLPGWSGAGYKSPAAAWLFGAAVFICQARPLHTALRFRAATHASLTPPLLAVILAAPKDAFPRNDAMQVGMGAGTVTWAQIEEAKARIAPRILNLVSATESGRMALTVLDTPEDHRWHCLSKDRVVEIVDEFDHPTRVGEVGRVRISTRNAPNGYLDDEAATRAFFKDGFFYPGDLAVRRADGRIALQGRATDVINMAGFKIMPAPIEDRLRESLDVSGVCLFSMQDDAGDEELHVIVEAIRPVAVDRLSELLWREVAAFPRAHVHYLPTLPRNENGKVMRLAARRAALAAWRPAEAQG